MPGVGERLHFVEVQAWRELAQWAGDLKKSDELLVVGRLINDYRYAF